MAVNYECQKVKEMGSSLDGWPDLVAANPYAAKEKPDAE